MKHTLALIVPVAAAMLLASCSSDDSVLNSNSQDDSAIPIRLATKTEGLTRVFAQNTVIENGEKVYVWADKANDNSQWFGAWELTADGKNHLTSTETKYYPPRANVNLYAIHGNLNHFTANAAFPTEPYTHLVLDNQTTNSNYAQSDLLYGVLSNQKHSDDSVQITMHHMLSNIRVILASNSAGLSDSLLKLATVELVGVRKAVKFTPKKASADEVNVRENRAGWLAIDSTYAAGNITMSTTTTALPTTIKSDWAKDDEGAEAVLPPQTLKAGQVIKITINDKGRDNTKDGYDGLTLYASLANDYTIESGKYYVFQITVTPSEANFAGINVASWVAEDRDAGDLTPTDSDFQR